MNTTEKQPDPVITLPTDQAGKAAAKDAVRRAIQWLGGSPAGKPEAPAAGEKPPPPSPAPTLGA